MRPAVLILLLIALCDLSFGGAMALQASPDLAQALAAGSPLTPQMYGAKGDGRADDSEAVAAWLGSGHGLVCDGTFKLTHRVTVALKPHGGLALHGAGRQLCKFVLATPTAALVIDGGTPDIYSTPQVVLHDFSLAPAAVLLGPALTIAFTGGGGATDPTLDLRDVAIKPTAQAFHAPTCLRLDNVRNGVAQAVNCEGHRGAYLPGSRGIVITGDSQPVELTLRDVNTYFMDIGIALEGTWQGVAISEAVCVPCRVGVKAVSSDDRSVWLRVRDSHFNVEDAGIEAINIATVHATGNFVYLNDVGSPQSAYRACVSLTMLSQATQWAIVSGNTCDGVQSHAGPKYGVYLDSARPPASFLMESRVEGNAFYTLDDGIHLANTAAVTIGANTYAFMSHADVWNGANGSGIFKNSRTPADEPLRSDAR